MISKAVDTRSLIIFSYDPCAPWTCFPPAPPVGGYIFPPRRNSFDWNDCVTSTFIGNSTESNSAHSNRINHEAPENKHQIGENKKTLTSFVNWVQLQEELIGLIAKRVLAHELRDLLNFGAVCRTWRSISTDKSHFHGGRPQIPWLLGPRWRNETQNYRIFNILAKKHFKLPFPQINQKIFQASPSENIDLWGSRHGWLIVLASGRNSSFSLNPITSHQIQLPDATRNINRVNLCLWPNSSSSSIGAGNYIVVAFFASKRIRDSEVCIAKHGDKTWTTVTILGNPLLLNFTGNLDVICIGNQLYVADATGSIFICDVTGPRPEASLISSKLNEKLGHIYLMEMSGDLYIVHLVTRDYTITGEMTTTRRNFYDIYKMNFGTSKWVQLSGTGDYTIFAGNNSTIALLASDYPKLKRNCAYCADEPNEFYACRMGIYSFGDNTTDFILNDMSSDLPQSWITPTRC
ncbi:hypothetical protein GIB67_020586 [Kingdonia uniflora]|uniref:KIB1-4 beta-propeller domain-containing protein n=1 Tax=Kingdonia uniflora TaxID=39325 RepID=A0A7J7NV80_9MAGN|nr:hypothetical protein GIB67_020586 [Kingdonia uniflora]